MNPSLIFLLLLIGAVGIAIAFIIAGRLPKRRAVEAKGAEEDENEDDPWAWDAEKYKKKLAEGFLSTHVVPVAKNEIEVSVLKKMRENHGFYAWVEFLLTNGDTLKNLSDLDETTRAIVQKHLSQQQKQHRDSMNDLHMRMCKEREEAARMKHLLGLNTADLRKEVMAECMSQARERALVELDRQTRYALENYNEVNNSLRDALAALRSRDRLPEQIEDRVRLKKTVQEKMTQCIDSLQALIERSTGGNKSKARGLLVAYLSSIFVYVPGLVATVGMYEESIANQKTEKAEDNSEVHEKALAELKSIDTSVFSSGQYDAAWKWAHERATLKNCPYIIWTSRDGSFCVRSSLVSYKEPDERSHTIIFPDGRVYTGEAAKIEIAKMESAPNIAHSERAVLEALAHRLGQKYGLTLQGDNMLLYQLPTLVDAALFNEVRTKVREFIGHIHSAAEQRLMDIDEDNAVKPDLDNIIRYALHSMNLHIPGLDAPYMLAGQIVVGNDVAIGAQTGQIVVGNDVAIGAQTGQIAAAVKEAKEAAQAVARAAGKPGGKTDVVTATEVFNAIVEAGSGVAKEIERLEEAARVKSLTEHAMRHVQAHAEREAAKLEQEKQALQQQVTDQVGRGGPGGAGGSGGGGQGGAGGAGGQPGQPGQPGGVA